MEGTVGAASWKLLPLTKPTRRGTGIRLGREKSPCEKYGDPVQYVSGVHASEPVGLVEGFVAGYNHHGDIKEK